MEDVKPCHPSPLISIIVPVYKSERFLPLLTDSILSQSFSDWELILVDDGSPDCSGTLCDEFVKRDYRIFAIHKKNGGISSARNVGIDNAHGKWLFFCDHDDYLPPESLSILSKAVQEPNLDLITASYIRFKDTDLQEDTDPGEAVVLPVRDYLEGTYASPSIRYNEFYVWNKLLKSSIIRDNHLRFREDIYYYEDVLFAYQYLFLCTQNVYCLNTPIYVYFKRDIGVSSSLTHHYCPKKSPGRLYSHILIYESYLTSSYCSHPLEYFGKFLKHNILDSYFWLLHSIRHSKLTYWTDIEKYTQIVRPYYSKAELISKWTVRHFHLRIRQFKRMLHF